MLQKRILFLHKDHFLTVTRALATLRYSGSNGRGAYRNGQAWVERIENLICQLKVTYFSTFKLERGLLHVQFAAERR